MGKGKGKRRFV